jgi:hypothetical protein
MKRGKAAQENGNKPINSINPIDSIDPTNPTDSSNPTNPTNSSNPTNPINSIDSTAEWGAWSGVIKIVFDWQFTTAAETMKRNVVDSFGLKCHTGGPVA